MLNSIHVIGFVHILAVPGRVRYGMFHCVHIFLHSLTATVTKTSAVPPTNEESPLPPSTPSSSTTADQRQINMTAPPHSKPFNPFCEVDQSQISIHCHINAISALLCIPGLVPQNIGKYNIPEYGWCIYI